MNEITSVLIDWLGRRPAVGTVITSIGVATGKTVGEFSQLLSIVKDCAAIVAYLIAIVTGILTVIGWFEKRKKQNNETIQLDKKN